ncbi:hypothetical protein [Micromonospora sp. WMMD1155]|uniref:hypothetical protein n=1 Tax=Micromonospora sp. WMMD1155 TaxID=3016094 RepID=UPI00249C3054|nr:hypothetical protein [Micromonospora sp. WMMD1155]WFE54887.1 hypothetical protein O7617_33005 [Micromonospora sp. WMMD1155]
MFMPSLIRTTSCRASGLPLRVRVGERRPLHGLRGSSERRTQVVGADAVAMRAQIAQAYDELRRQTGVADGQPVGRLNANLLGYRIVSYTDEEAILRLLTEAPNGSRSLSQLSSSAATLPSAPRSAPP